MLLEKGVSLNVYQQIIKVGQKYLFPRRLFFCLIMSLQSDLEGHDKRVGWL